MSWAELKITSSPGDNIMIDCTILCETIF